MSSVGSGYLAIPQQYRSSATHGESPANASGAFQPHFQCHRNGTVPLTPTGSRGPGQRVQGCPTHRTCGQCGGRRGRRSGGRTPRCWLQTSPRSHRPGHRSCPAAPPGSAAQGRFPDREEQGRSEEGGINRPGASSKPAPQGTQMRSHFFLLSHLGHRPKNIHFPSQST